MVEAQPEKRIDNLIKTEFEFDAFPVKEQLEKTFPDWRLFAITERGGLWMLSNEFGSDIVMFTIDKRFPDRQQVSLAKDQKGGGHHDHYTMWNPQYIETYIDEKDYNNNRLVVKKTKEPYNRVELYGDGRMLICVRDPDLLYVRFSK